MDDFDVTRLGDADFWFSPFSLPRYDWLVAEGHITQDEASRYRQERLDAGLPMATGALLAQPGPGFEWLWQSGKLSVFDGQEIEIDGIKFKAWAWGGNHGELSTHPCIANEGGYLCWELKAPWDEKPGVVWSAAFKLPGSEKVFARTSGKSATLADAVEAVRKQTFEPERIVDLDFYPHEKGWLAIGPEQMEIEIVPHWDAGKPSVFIWKTHLPEGTPLREMADLMYSFESALRGEAESREAAVTAALAAPNQARILAAKIVGDQAFEAGRLAGRRELMGEVLAL